MRAVMPMYDIVRDEEYDPAARRAAAEELVGVGLLRRRRAGASRPFLWLLGLTLVVVSAAAASSIGPAAVALFAAGAAALVAYHSRSAKRERRSGAYIGPHGDVIEVPVRER